MNAAQGRARRWASLSVLLVGLLLLGGRVLASGNGISPLSLACPWGQVTWLEGTRAPGRALLVRFAGVIVGGGSSDASGRWRIPLQVSVPAGIYPVVVVEREGGELVAAFTCYVDLPVGATPTGTPTRRPTQPPSPSSPATATVQPSATTLPTPTTVVLAATTAPPTATASEPPPSPTSAGITPTSPSTTATPSAAGPPAVALVTAQADDPQDPELFEYVIVENKSPGPQELAGWRLVHHTTAEAYVFPAVTLLPGEQLVVWSGVGEDEPATGLLFWPATTGRWAAGDTAELHNPAGQVVSVLLVVPPEDGQE